MYVREKENKPLYILKIYISGVYLGLWGDGDGKTEQALPHLLLKAIVGGPWASLSQARAIRVGFQALQRCSLTHNNEISGNKLFLSFKEKKIKKKIKLLPNLCSRHPIEGH